MKTMKHIIWMAAIALTGTIMTACSNEDVYQGVRPCDTQKFSSSFF